jgi:hypothetical protein
LIDLLITRPHALVHRKLRLSDKKMSEEQPIFKVTDRRLFNADGTPREVEREEEQTQAAAASAAETSAAASDEQKSTQTEARSSSSAGDNAQASVAAEDARHDESPLEDEAREGSSEQTSIPGVDDPASFINFLMSIASNAAAALGMMEHPVTGERGVDLELGKHWIDVLGMLQQKTRGNLAPQEKKILDDLLSDLRMQFVSLTRSAEPQPPRGFTGRDIIGGK